jgi:hypothetical protein
MMNRYWIAGAFLFTSLTAVALAEDKPKHDHDHGQFPKAPTNANFEKMKQLVGTWVEADKDGKPTDKVMSIVKLTAGGSAIHETFFPGQAMEMVSVYVPEGEDLHMTHYCMLGNQPKLKADPKSPANQIVFKFAGGTNLDPKKDKHMHDATLTIVDADHLQIDGVGWENGAPAKEMCGVMKLVRKK